MKAGMLVLRSKNERIGLVKQKREKYLKKCSQFWRILWGEGGRDMLTMCKGNIHHTPAMLEVMPTPSLCYRWDIWKAKWFCVCSTQAWLLNGFCSPFHSFSEVYFVVTLVKSICPYGVTSVLHMMVHKTLQTHLMCHNFIPHSLEN